jgi:hypothetical protein
MPHVDSDLPAVDLKDCRTVLLALTQAFGQATGISRCNATQELSGTEGSRILPFG